MAAPYVYVSSEEDQKPRWVDWLDPEDQDMDLFFDRLCIIIYDDGQKRRYMAPGVIIWAYQVITSLNPFREIIQSKQESKLKIAVLLERTITDWKDVTYKIEYYDVFCIRAIVPLLEDQPWHGIEQKHSPLHDIAALKTTTVVWEHNTNAIEDEIWKIPLNYYSFENYSKTGSSPQKAGPIYTPYYETVKDEPLPRELKFASLGFKDDQHILDSCYLRTVEFKTDDNVVEDCDEWIPREWGYFICLKNLADFKGVGSGAMLFDLRGRIFGIGSFLLQKGQRSILVFTDIRPYRTQIRLACTVNEEEHFALHKKGKKR